MRVIHFVAVLGAALCGCSVAPKYTYTYYLPEAVTAVGVVQTIDCDKARKHLVIDIAEPTVGTLHRADFTRPMTLDTSRFGGAWSEGKVEVAWYEDGRLKSLNQESAGQGEAIVKAALSLFSAFGGGGPPAAADDTVLCTQLAALGGDGPISLTYKGELSSYEAGDSAPLEPAAGSRFVHEQVKRILGTRLPTMELTVAEQKVLAHPQPRDLTERNSVPLNLNEVGVVTLELSHGQEKRWSGRALVPLSGEYKMLIPEARAFGKNSFGVTLGASGNVESVKYSQAPGSAGAMGAATSVVQAANPTARQTADALKAEADLIVQSRRLAACRNDPSTCQ